MVAATSLRVWALVQFEGGLIVGGFPIGRAFRRMTAPATTIPTAPMANAMAPKTGFCPVTSAVPLIAIMPTKPASTHATAPANTVTIPKTLMELF